MLNKLLGSSTSSNAYLGTRWHESKLCTPSRAHDVYEMLVVLRTRSGHDTNTIPWRSPRKRCWTFPSNSYIWFHFFLVIQIVVPYPAVRKVAIDICSPISPSIYISSGCHLTRMNLWISKYFSKDIHVASGLSGSAYLFVLGYCDKISKFLTGRPLFLELFLFQNGRAGNQGEKDPQVITFQLTGRAANFRGRFQARGYMRRLLPRRGCCWPWCSDYSPKSPGFSFSLDHRLLSIRYFSNQQRNDGRELWKRLNFIMLSNPRKHFWTGVNHQYESIWQIVGK